MPVVVVSFKFITSNYKQNSNNYFENLLGECANIKRANIGFAHFLVLRGHTPHYTKNKGNLRGELKKIEVLSEKDILKYIKLYSDMDYPHKPDVLGIGIIDFDKYGKAYFTNLKNLGFSENIINILNKDLSLKKFIKRVVGLCHLKD